MVNYEFFMNSFFAISIDIYNKKEYFVYSVGYANEFFNNKPKNVNTEIRELGEFVFDFSSSIDSFSSCERYNVFYNYLCNYESFINSNTSRWKYDDELFIKQERFTNILKNLKAPILSDDFVHSQKHLSLNNRHRYSSYEALKNCYPNIISETGNDLRIFYKEDMLYIATDFNFIGLLRYYLDELYDAGMFPRSCMNCGKFFLSGKNNGDVLCSDKCKRKKKTQNTMVYYKKLSENEKLYNNLYSKWKQRIDRAEQKQIIKEDGIAKLRDEIKELTYINRTKANERKKGNVPEKDGLPDFEAFDSEYRNVLLAKDSFLYTLFNSLKKD